MAPPNFVPAVQEQKGRGKAECQSVTDSHIPYSATTTEEAGALHTYCPTVE